MTNFIICVFLFHFIFIFNVFLLQCLEVIKTGLGDPDVRPSRRYLLYQRAEKICGGPNSKYANRLTSIEPVRVTEAPEVVFFYKIRYI